YSGSWRTKKRSRRSRKPRSGFSSAVGMSNSGAHLTLPFDQSKRSRGIPTTPRPRNIFLFGMGEPLPQALHYQSKGGIDIRICNHRLVDFDAEMKIETGKSDWAGYVDENRDSRIA